MTNINDQIRLIFEGKKSLGNQEHAELYKLTVHLRSFTPANPDEAIQESTVVKLVKSFTSLTHSLHTRRWIGLLLLQALRSTNTTLQHLSSGSNDFAMEISYIILSSTSEALRIVAGAIIQWERTNGVPHDRLWSRDVAQHAELNFPQKQDSQWVENLEGFLDALEDVEDFKDSGAEISWASHVTIGQVELPESGVKPGRVAVILETDLLTFVTSGPPSSLRFIDITLSNIVEVKIEGRRLKSSGDASTQTACQLSIQLREGPQTYSVNGKQRSAETVAIMFAEPDQAKELLVQIKAQLESHRVSDIQHTSPEPKPPRHLTEVKPTVVATASMQLPDIIPDNRYISAQSTHQARSTKLRDQLRNEKGEAPSKPVQQEVLKSANKSHKKQPTKNEKVNTSALGSTKQSAKTAILIDSDTYDVPSSPAETKKYPVNAASRNSRESTFGKTQAQKTSRVTKKKTGQIKDDQDYYVGNRDNEDSIDPKGRTRASTAKINDVPPSNNVIKRKKHGTGTDSLNGNADGYDAYLMDSEQEDEVQEVFEPPKLPSAQKVLPPQTRKSKLLVNSTVADPGELDVGEIHDQEDKRGFVERLSLTTKENPIVIEDENEESVFQWDTADAQTKSVKSVNPADLLLDRSIRKPSLIAFNIDGPVNQGTRVSDPIIKPVIEEEFLEQTVLEDLSDSAAHSPIEQTVRVVHIPSKRTAVEFIAPEPQQKRAKSSHISRNYRYDDTAPILELDTASKSSSPEPPKPTGSQLSRRVDVDGSPQPANIRLPLYTSPLLLHPPDTEIDLVDGQTGSREYVELIPSHPGSLNQEAVHFDEIEHVDMQISSRDVAESLPIIYDKPKLSKFMQALLGSVGARQEQKEVGGKPHVTGNAAGLCDESGDTLVEEEALEEISIDEDDEEDAEENDDSEDEQGDAMTLSTSPSSSYEADAGEENHDTVYEEELEWEESLKPHQYGIADALGRITQRLLRHLVDRETAVEGIVSDYRNNGLRLITDFEEAHQHEFNETAAELVSKRDVLFKGLRVVAQGSKKERDEVKSLAAGFEEVVKEGNSSGKRQLKEVGGLIEIFGTHRPL